MNLFSRSTCLHHTGVLACWTGLLLALLARDCVAQAQSRDEYISWQGPCGLANEAGMCNRSSTVVLGGLFPLHRTNANASSTAAPVASNLCGDEILTVGFERMEAMRYAIEEINARSDILPDIQLAFEMRDTCVTPIYTNQQTVRFVQREDTASCTAGLLPISGVVGASSSGPSIAAADLLRIFLIPQISPASTSATLSEERYDYFLRTVPPDVFQAKAIVGIMHALGLRYPGVLSTLGAYGQDGVAEVRRELEAKNAACIAASATLEENRLQPEDSPIYTAALDDLLDNISINATANVAFSGKDAMLGFSRAIAGRSGRLPSKFTWFATDAWSQNVAFLDSQVINVTKGTIGVSPSTRSVERFTDHFLSLHPSNNTGPRRNPWLSEFWESVFNCNPDPCTNGSVQMPAYCQQCLRNSLRNSSAFPYVQNSKIAFVFNAVYAFARALDALQRARCGPGQGLCSAMQSRDESRNGAVDGPALLAFLKSLTFIGEDGSTVAFDQRGDLESAVYRIHNIQLRPGDSAGTFESLGTWEQLPHNHSATVRSTNYPNGTLEIVDCSDPAMSPPSCSRSRLIFHTANIQWRDGTSGLAQRPLSRCSPPCDVGQRAVAIRSFPASLYPTCCWRCEQCPLGTFITEQNSTCRECPERQEVNRDQTDCVDLVRDVFSTGDKSALACIGLSAVLLIPTLVSIPIIIAVMDLLPLHSAMRFSSMMISTLGTVGVCVLPFLYLIHPGQGSCILRAVWSILSLTALITPFLVENLDNYYTYRKQRSSSLPEEIQMETKPTPDAARTNAVTQVNANSDEKASSRSGSDRAKRRRRSLAALAKEQSFVLWGYMAVFSVVITVTVMSIAVDLPEILDVVTRNVKWETTCKLSAVYYADLVCTIILVVGAMSMRFYCLFRGIYVPFTFRLATFMMLAVLLLVASLLIAYTQLEIYVVKDAVLLLLQLAVALALYSVVVQDLFRTLIPERNTNKGQMYSGNQGDGLPGIGEQIQMTLAERSLFNAERRRNRSSGISQPSNVSRSEHSQPRSGYGTGDSDDTLGQGSDGSMENKNGNKPEKYLPGGSHVSVESGYGGKASEISHPEQELSPLSFAQKTALSDPAQIEHGTRSQENISHAVAQYISGDSAALSPAIDDYCAPVNALSSPVESPPRSASSDNLLSEGKAVCNPVSEV